MLCVRCQGWLEFFEFDAAGFFFGVDKFKIFFGGGNTFMSDNLGNNIDGNTGFELKDNKSVAKVIDFDALNVSFSKKAV